MKYVIYIYIYLYLGLRTINFFVDIFTRLTLLSAYKHYLFDFLLFLFFLHTYQLENQIKEIILKNELNFQQELQLFRTFNAT